MILIIRYDSTWEELNPLLCYCQQFGVETHERYGEQLRQIALIGDTSHIDRGKLLSYDIVERVIRMQEPYKRSGRKQHPEDTVFDIKGTLIGGGNFLMVAGPCSVESEDQIFTIAEAVKKAGAQMLKGGAYIPRSSPFTFSGLREKGIELLVAAGKEFGLPVMTEAISISQLSYFEDVDLIQVGTRNMQNYELLRELGNMKKHILLRRGPGFTVKELFQSAEYVMSFGNSNVILSGGGIRTFETTTQYSIDIGSIVSIKQESHLPLLVDPSYAAGRAKYVLPLALASTAAGTDGLIIDVHNDPHAALAHAHLALSPEKFTELVKRVKAVREAAFGE